MHVYQDIYFKTGLSLPNPEHGPYVFICCTFNPALKVVLLQSYSNSIFVNCDLPYDCNLFIVSTEVN